MSSKIILGDLEKCMFPEIYPYFKGYFKEESQAIRDGHAYDDTTFYNISFKIKLTRYSLLVKGEELREYFYIIFEKHVELFYNWRKEYDWYELKSLLAFWIIFSDVKNYSEFTKRLKDPKSAAFLRKYLPEPVVTRIPI